VSDRPGETRIAAGALLRGDAIAGAHLLVSSGPGAGRRLLLGEVQTLGRGPAADLRLEDPAASRLHLRLERVDGGYLAEDLGSKNGFRLNGERCSGARPLHAGDEVEIGGTRLVLTAGSLDAAAPAARPGADGGPAPGEGAAPRRLAVSAVLLAAAALAAAAAALAALP
jgi:pSer/pThr/pTyr-binding forkhead associated (FHA) protein